MVGEEAYLYDERVWVVSGVGFTCGEWYLDDMCATCAYYVFGV